MSNTQTPEWEKEFDKQFFYQKDAQPGKLKAFISQQLTAYSKEINQNVIGEDEEFNYDEGDADQDNRDLYIGAKIGRNDLRAEQRQALSKVNKDWGMNATK